MIKKMLFLTLFTLIIISSLYPEEKEPVIYLEFTNFSEFLTELGNDSGYRNFMSSSVIEWYKNTRLGLKFPKRLGAFEEILGFSLSLENMKTLSGKETGIWLFDIGELELLIITKISRSDYLRSRIARSRESFGEGRIDTVTYYFKKDPSGNKEVDFAFLDGYLIISNEPDEFEHFLRRFLGDNRFTEWKNADFLEWYAKPLNPDYDILLYLSQGSIRNTYFTSYWFYENKDEIREWFDRGIITVKKEEKKIIEKRIYKLAEGFSFDSLSLRRTKSIFSLVPQDADLVKILPVYGEEFESGIKQLLGKGESADSIFLSVEKMGPVCFGNFVKVRDGEILPELEEGIVVVVEKPDKGMIELFDRFFPVNLRNHKVFSGNMPDLAMQDDILFFSNTKDFFREKKEINPSGITFYSWLNFERFCRGFEKEMELLKDSERWRSYDDRDFFKKNVGDLIGISSAYIKSIEKKGKIEDGKMLERVIYLLE